MQHKLTRRQGQFLSFIHRYTVRRGAAPSFDEIATHFGISAPSVNSMILRLERNGLLSRVPGAARTLRVEVPAHLLPEAEFGSWPKRVQEANPGVAATPSVDLAVAVGVSMLEVMAPLALEAGVRAQTILAAILAAADAAMRMGDRMGLTPNQASELGRRLGAEAARWSEAGRGVSIRNRAWRRADRRS